LAKAAAVETKNREEQNRLQLEEEYKQFCEERVTLYIEKQMDRGNYENRLKSKLEEVRVTWPRLPMPSLQEIAQRALRSDLQASVTIPTFHEFCQHHRQMGLFKTES
jgi:hypothetical protein